jgi:flagellar biosynthesis protein
MNERQNKAAALKYRPGVDSAPSIVAKGRGSIAEKIIALARKHGIPIREDRDMVEVLSTLDMYEEIPPELYKAVAEILAFIYKMSGKM